MSDPCNVRRLVGMRDELYDRFEADYRRAEAKRRPPLCQRCGEPTECHHNRFGECHICDFQGARHAGDPDVLIDFRFQDIVWAEAVAARKRGTQTARTFFNRLRLSARIALMRELLARQQVASAGMGKVTPTMRWLAAGLKPHVL